MNPGSRGRFLHGFRGFRGGVHESDREAHPGDGPAGSSTFRSVKFSPIPRALDEVREIKGLWEKRFAGPGGADCLLLEGKAACEEAFKRLAPHYRFIHLATHGIFQDSEPEASASGRDAKAKVKATAPAKSGVWGFVGGDHPLLLSGLALAGANRRSEATGDQEDGILTAEEIATLDLTGVDLAVLSGCETGAGIIVPGEGIFGLRRAFLIAGARTLVMSLWRVKDEDTRYWMKYAYESRLDRQTVPQAMKSASLAVLECAAAAWPTDHPFYWGAWVSAGSWR